MAPSLWHIRGNNDHTDVDEVYVNLPHIFTIRVHRGGIFSASPGRRYLFGKVNYVDFVDIDEFSGHELCTMFEELGYAKKARIYYHFLIPGLDLDCGLLPLGNDEDVIRLSTYVAKNKEIRVYAEHGINTLKNYLMSPTKVVIEQIDDTLSPELCTSKKARKETGSCSKKLDFDLNDPNPNSLSMVVYNCPNQENKRVTIVEDVNEPIQESVQQENMDMQGEHVPEIVQEESVEEDPLANQGPIDFNDPFFLFEPADVPYHGDIEEDYDMPLEQDIMNDYEEDGRYSESEVEGAEGVNEDAEGPTGDEGPTSDSDSDFIVDDDEVVDDIDEVDMAEFHSVIDTNVEWLPREKTGQPQATCEEEEELEVIDEDCFEFAGYEDNKRKRLLKEMKKPQYCSQGKVHESVFKIGKTFQTKKEITELVKEHALESRRALHVAKNDKIRVKAVCRGVMADFTSSGLLGTSKGEGSSVNTEKGTCPWALLVSRASENDVWTVKTFKDRHLCLHTREIKSCTQSFIAKKIVSQIEMNPNCPVLALQDEFQKKYGVGISASKVFRAKVIVRDWVHGDYEKQYNMLREYIMELQATNRDTTVKLEVESEPNYNLEIRKFKRIYICLGALKNGFKQSQREIIGLDGSFMKGPFPGQILTAVSVDSNNGMFPVAYAIVEAETMRSWCWFLECLGEDLDLPTRANFTFISDRQKGLIPAVAKMFPCAEHRFCLRHIHENMKLKWRGSELKDMLWKCATATTVIHFEKAMEEFQVFTSG